MIENKKLIPMMLGTSDLDDVLGGMDPTFSYMVELGQSIGAANLNKMMDMMGGQNRHVPTTENFWGAIARYMRDQMILTQFDGKNYEELAAIYDCTTMSIRRSIKDAANTMNTLKMTGQQ